MLSSRPLPGTPSTIGYVASTMGTAPRNPAQDRKACSRSGTRKPVSDTMTDTGRATSSSTRPATIAGTRSSTNWDGVTNRPSSTNNPIWASHPEPSANDFVADRCGNPELASTTLARYAATKALASAAPPAANARMPHPNVASG